MATNMNTPKRGIVVRKRGLLAEKVAAADGVDVAASPRKGLAALLNNNSKIVAGLYGGGSETQIASPAKTIRSFQSPLARSKYMGEAPQSPLAGMYSGLKGSNLFEKTGLALDENLIS